jgi:uncharacterized protein YndB with AHSA1/START domain
MDNQENKIAPIHKETAVPLAQEEAFRLFTEGIDEWWPLDSHSIFEKRARKAVFENRLAGRIYEISDDGEEGLWGKVTVCEPPRRLVFTWHPGRKADTAQEVEVRFQPESTGTRVLLDHRGWEKYGKEAAAARKGYDSGWDYVLGERFRSAAEGSG